MQTPPPPTESTVMITIAANDTITRNVNFVVADRIIEPRLINISRGLSESKSLNSSMCLGKLAIIFKEANLKPRIEGKKAEEEFEFSSTLLFFPAAGVWSALMEIGIQYTELLSKAFTNYLNK